MYLDNSLNKLLPSCLLLPLLLRVISVLIVFLSIRSHCFSGLFLCYFLSTKINYKHPPELGARTYECQRGVSAMWQWLNACLGARHFRAFGGDVVSFQHHRSNWMLEAPPNPTLYYFHLVVYLLVWLGGRVFTWLLKLFFIVKKWIYFYFWLCWISVAVPGLSLVALSGGCSLLQHTSFSLPWPPLLPGMGSRVHGLQ